MLPVTRKLEPLELAGRRVLVLGLGANQGGVGVVRYLCAQGADVRVTDMQDAERLAESLAQLADLPVAYTLGGHAEEDFGWADIVVRNPGVPRESEWLALARSHGARIEMEMMLFFRACAGPIFGVSGTKGKTTTSTALHTMLLSRYPDAVLAGNMGRSALTELDSVSPRTPVVLELSSFQLEALDEQRLSPEVAVLTNISEDHLDRYVSLQDYAAVKAAIARHQSRQGWLVINRDDPIVEQAVVNQGMAARITFGRRAVTDDNAFWVDEGSAAGRWHGEEVSLGRLADLKLLGEHAQLNVLAAAGAALAGGLTPEDIAASLQHIEPVPDRLEPVAEHRGVLFINDTTATIPAAAIAALRAFDDKRLIVIAGGSDKRVDLRPFAEELALRAARVVLLAGDGTTCLQAALADLDYQDTVGPLDSMEAAVQHAAEPAEPGDVVLLSPGCASFGMFRNEFHRGAEFKAAVARLVDAEGSR